MTENERVSELAARLLSGLLAGPIGTVIANGDNKLYTRIKAIKDCVEMAREIVRESNGIEKETQDRT